MPLDGVLTHDPVFRARRLDAVRHMQWTWLAALVAGLSSAIVVLYIGVTRGGWEGVALYVAMSGIQVLLGWVTWSRRSQVAAGLLVALQVILVIGELQRLLLLQFLLQVVLLAVFVGGLRGASAYAELERLERLAGGRT